MLRLRKPRGVAGYEHPPFAKTAKQREADAILAARPNVMHFLTRGGSRSGKTFWNVRAVCARALMAPESRHAIWRQRYNHLKASIVADTFPKVMKHCFPNVKAVMHRQDGYAEMPNGSQIWFGGLDNKERAEKVLGQEYATVYYNECSQIGYTSVLMGLTRLAQSVTVPSLGRPMRLLGLYDCNPPRKAHWTYKQFFEHVDPITGRALEGAEDYAELQINPRDNPHLPAEYLKTLSRLPPAERKRFLDGEYGEGVEGALWSWAHFARAPSKLLPDMRRIVVGVDPPAKAKGAEAGIIVAGQGVDGRGYLLADGSVRGRPEEWARAACNLYRKWQADAIVAEVNQGGDMVRAVIHGCDPYANVVQVHATRGKHVRAEPVAALYADRRILHVGDFGELENQMVEFTSPFDVAVMGYSPDRVDAAVWAFTDLMLEKHGTLSTAKVQGT